MAALADQPDDTSTVTNARSFPNQPIPTGHDGTDSSANPTTVDNSTAKPLPGTPHTGKHITDTSPTVVSRPNPASASNTNRAQVQRTPSRPMSPPERRSTGFGTIGYDPIRGDIPQHQMYMLDMGVEEDVQEVPNRPGGRNGVKRHSAHRPRSMKSRREGTVVGPVSRRGSRMMTDESDEIPVGILFFLPTDEIGRFSCAPCRQRRLSKRGCSQPSTPQQWKETNIGKNVRCRDLQWAVCSRWC